jgi:AcrR family transcriptional regulator
LKAKRFRRIAGKVSASERQGSGRRDGAETRRRILHAAERRLIKGGPEAIRLQKIAADTGLSHPAILHHFKSRAGLVEAIILDGFSGLQSQFLAGWPSKKELDLEGIFERFYEVSARGGVARLLAWLLLSGRGLEPGHHNFLKPAAERMHAGRMRRAQRNGRRAPEFEESQMAASFLLIVVLGDSLFGVTARKAMGLHSDAATTAHFRHWLINLFERIDQR